MRNESFSGKTSEMFAFPESNRVAATIGIAYSLITIILVFECQACSSQKEVGTVPDSTDGSA